VTGTTFLGGSGSSYGSNALVPGNVGLATATIIGWSANSTPATTDAVLGHESTAVLQQGADATAQNTPVNQTYKGPDGLAGTGTNINGANLTIAAGRNTGTGTGGSLLFQTAPAGSTGTAAGTLTTRMTIDSTGLVTVPGGYSSTDTTAAVSIAATGWTNTFGRNAVVYYDGTAVTATVFNGAGTAIYTNAVALSGGSILLQTSGKVILSGTGVTGRAAVF
jgi:hypothetical protein